jgi:Icc protein
VRIAWTTDLHLNFASDTGIDQFIEEVRDVRSDVVLIGGDIGEADSFTKYLEHIADALELPVYFVLGNHDYYKDSISGVRESASALSQQSNVLSWLSDLGPVWLTDRTALVGHGGWGDARAADFLKSDVILNDYLLIQELRDASCGGSVSSVDNILSTNLCPRSMSNTSSPCPPYSK